MKRAILEWTSIGLMGLALTLVLFWAVFRYLDAEVYHWQVSTSNNTAGNDLHVLIGQGELVVCDQLTTDINGTVRPIIVKAEELTDAQNRLGASVVEFRWLSGIDYRSFRLLLPSGPHAWSLRVSLLWPAALALGAGWLVRRWLPPRNEPNPPETPDPE